MDGPFYFLAAAIYLARLVAVSLTCLSVPMLGAGMLLLFLRVRLQGEPHPGWIGLLAVGMIALSLFSTGLCEIT